MNIHVDDRLIRTKEVLHITSVSRATLWRWCRKGTFPQPIKLGNQTLYWLESDVHKWITELTNGKK